MDWLLCIESAPGEVKELRQAFRRLDSSALPYPLEIQLAGQIFGPYTVKVWLESCA